MSKIPFDRPPPSCPYTIEQVLEYVRMESADRDDLDESSLVFLRTARIEATDYWLWLLTERDGSRCYVVVGADEGGEPAIVLVDEQGRPPEDFLAWAHRQPWMH